MVDDYRYAIDADKNLVPGSVLRFAYSGSGVATLIDRDGTGFKVPVGTRNLATIFTNEGGAAALLLMDESEASYQPENPTPYDALDREALLSLARSRGIPFNGRPGAAKLIAFLVATDEGRGCTPDTRVEGEA